MRSSGVTRVRVGDDHDVQVQVRRWTRDARVGDVSRDGVIDGPWGAAAGCPGRERARPRTFSIFKYVSVCALWSVVRVDRTSTIQLDRPRASWSFTGASTIPVLSSFNTFQICVK